MGNRSRPLFFAGLIALVISIAVGVGWFLAKQSSEFAQAGAVVAGREVPVMQKTEVHLYFGDNNGRFLTAEQRVVDAPRDIAAAARGLVQELVQGPLQGGTRTLPPDAGLRALFVTGEGLAVLDFKADAFEHHPGGVETELLSIYSIVNTLVLNMVEIRRVKFLIGGQEAATLAGHVDLSHPFQADMLWVR